MVSESEIKENSSPSLMPFLNGLILLPSNLLKEMFGFLPVFASSQTHLAGSKTQRNFYE